MTPEFTSDCPWSHAAVWEAMINWEARSRNELPFYQQHLPPTGRVLDIGCGPGRQAIWLAQAGYAAAGCDLSEEMLDLARRQAALESLSIDFFAADMRELPVPSTRFDGVLCVGNTICFLPSPEDLHQFLTGVARMLSTQGTLILQFLNLHRVVKTSHHPIRKFAMGDREVVSMHHVKPVESAAGSVQRVRSYRILWWREKGEWKSSLQASLADFLLTGTNTLMKLDGWKSAVQGCFLTAWTPEILESALASAGFARPTWYGDHQGSAFDIETSRELIGVVRLSPDRAD